MKGDSRFMRLPKSFWADVRTIGEAVGYSKRNQDQVGVPTLESVRKKYAERELDTQHLHTGNQLTPTGQTLFDYFQYRADALNQFVEPRLMDSERAKVEFERLRSWLKPKCPLPMNKQRGNKKAPAYLTGIVNMLVEANCGAYSCDYEPRRLTTVTANNAPLRTFARRVDGAFPTVVNPIAIWEVKEYYHTTTFGSRVADGVYETLLDGMEIEELAESEDVHLLHYLIIDSHYTWWKCGRSYLCRIVDMIHMGFVDEVLFGYETVERLPKLVKQWVKAMNLRER